MAWYAGPTQGSYWHSGPTVASSWEAGVPAEGNVGYGAAKLNEAVIPDSAFVPLEAVGSEKAYLIQEIRRRDAELTDLRAEAERLRGQHEQMLAAYAERAAALESRLLHGHVEAVQGPPDQERALPSYLQRPARFLEEQEFQRQEDERQAALFDPTIPPGGRVVSVRYLPGESLLQEVPPAPVEKPAKKEEPKSAIMGEGPLYNSNFVLTPSPHHPMHWLNTQGQMGNIYPITRPPRGNAGLFPVFPSFIRPSPEFHPKEGTWQREADFFTNRNCPTNWVKETFKVEDRIGRKGGMHEQTVWRQAVA